MNDKRERIACGLRVAAGLVAQHGVEFLPYFERLEREHAQLKATESALERARRIAGRL